MISIPLINAPSRTFCLGMIHLLHPSSLACITIGRIPGTSLMLPSRLNSPITSVSLSCSPGNTPMEDRIASAIGRSKDDPFFLTVAGARLTTIFFAGIWKPELWIAVLTRSEASLTSEER